MAQGKGPQQTFSHSASYRTCEGRASWAWAFRLWRMRFHPVYLLNIAISLSLKIPPSTLSQRILSISNSFLLGHLLINTSTNHSNKLLTPLFNCAGFRVKPRISTQKTHINKFRLFYLYVPSTLSHSLKIHFHLDSPDFCLNELAQSSSSVAVLCTSSWTVLPTFPPGACFALSLVIGLKTTVRGT